MAEARFYHLTQSPLENLLPKLLTRALDEGWRVLVRGRDAKQLSWLDQKLWQGDAAGFLPHGLAGGPHDGDQPILLGTDLARPNGAVYLVNIDGAEIAPADFDGLERVSILFDGNDPDALAHARTQWKTLTDAGIKAQYWSEEGGRWQMKAER